MDTQIIGNKLITMAGLYKTTLRSLIQKDGGYIVPEDYPQGWTTGYFADLGGLTKDEAATVAKLLDLKHKLQRYVTDEAENKPKVSSIIPEGGEPVVDVMTDFSQEDAVKLISETQHAWVRGRYLAHFINNYPGCTFTIVGPLKAIKVCNGNSDLIGLIMPIRVENND